MGELMRTQRQLVELGARDLPFVGDHLGRQPLRDQVVALHQLRWPRRSDLVDPVEADAHGHMAHVLDTRPDHHVVDPGRDQRRREVDRLLGRAALAVDRGRGGLYRKAGL